MAITTKGNLPLDARPVTTLAKTVVGLDLIIVLAVKPLLIESLQLIATVQMVFMKQDPTVVLVIINVRPARTVLPIAQVVPTLLIDKFLFVCVMMDGTMTMLLYANNVSIPAQNA
jgi:hypothetical protein